MGRPPDDQSRPAGATIITRKEYGMWTVGVGALIYVFGVVPIAVKILRVAWHEPHPHSYRREYLKRRKATL